jgi:homoserine O-acetyltransferase
VFAREGVQEMVDILRRSGRPVEVAEVTGERGHLNGVLNVEAVGERVRAFLAQ